MLPSTAWHPEFEDVNNDGFVDLFVTKGNVEAQPDYATRDPSNLLLGQADGTFVDGAEAAGIVDFERARGAALVDLNLDGMLDLVVVNRRANVKLWRNVGRGDASDPRRWVTGSRSGSGNRRRTSMRSARGWTCAWATAPSPARSPWAAGHAGGQGSAGSTRAWARRTARRSASNGRTARPGHG